MLDVANGLNQAEAAHDRPGTVRFQDIPTDVLITAHNGIHHATQGQSVGPKAIRVHVNLILLDLAANARDLGNAGHGIELVPDEPVLQRAQLAQVMSRSFDGVPEHVPNPGSIWSQRGNDARRHLLAYQVEPLQHASAGEVEIDVVLKDCENHRETKGRTRTHDAHAR